MTKLSMTVFGLVATAAVLLAGCNDLLVYPSIPFSLRPHPLHWPPRPMSATTAARHIRFRCGTRWRKRTSASAVTSIRRQRKWASRRGVGASGPIGHQAMPSHPRLRGLR